MKWLGAWLRVLVLACGSLLTFPVASEEVCIDRTDLPLIYKPDEPPVCPTPMLELIPSTIGRPPNFSAFELASCAGMWDAAAILEPEFVTKPGFIDPEAFFELAKAQRERSPLAELVEIRKAERERYLDFLQDPAWESGSAIPHAFSYCNGVMYRATGE